MLRKSWVLALTGILCVAGSLRAGTFGRVVPIGGAAADLALDEPRGVLYIANFTANRIEVMSLASSTIQTSINVASQPSSLSISPDGHWLIVANYGNNTSPATPNNGLTLIDLTANYAKQTFALGNPPLGVAFGIDNKALVVTTAEFIIFDPVVGSTNVLSTISAVAKQALPVPAANFPPAIVGAAVAASADYTTIYGLGDNLEFRFDVAHQAMAAYTLFLQSPRKVLRTDAGAWPPSGSRLCGFGLDDMSQISNLQDVG